MRGIPLKVAAVVDGSMDGCGVTFFAIMIIPSMLGTWRSVQVIKTDDGGHIASLERRYGYIDVNFRIELDGEEIYRSADFSPDLGNAFLERITWDTSEKNLLFLVANQVLFAYDLVTRSPILEHSFDDLEAPRLSLSDLGYEGN